MAPKSEIEVHEAVSISQRVSIGLIALSLSLLSLSLGLALFSSSSAALFSAPNLSLSSTPSTATAITLTWTAPGDDGAIGTATSYDLRMLDTPIAEPNFSSATQLPSPPAPQVGGSIQTYTATNLTPSTTYYFALKTSDEANNISALSNIAIKATTSLTEACVPTYSCGDWSTCIDSTQTRTCTVTNGCPAGLDQPATSQLCGAPVETTPTIPPVGGGTTTLARHIIAVGTGRGTAPLVRVVTPSTSKVAKQFAPFSGTDRNGTNVAVGEFTGDQLPDIVVGTGAGTTAKVKVFSDQGLKFAEFNPYPTQTRTGVAVAAGDVNGDGRDEIITAPATGPSQVRVFQYDRTAGKFVAYAQGFAYDRQLLNGFTVAAADLDLNGQAEIIVAPRTKGRSITILRVTSAKTLQKIRTFNAFSFTSASGVTVSAGDVNGDGYPEILATLGTGYWSDVKAFDSRGRLVASFEPFGRSFFGGASLTSLDVNGDGRDEVIIGPIQQAYPYLRIFRYSGTTRKFSQIQRYLVYPSQMQFGVRPGSL